MRYTQEEKKRGIRIFSQHCVIVTITTAIQQTKITPVYYDNHDYGGVVIQGHIRM